MTKGIKGLCGPDTEGKLRTFRIFMHVHMGIVKKIFNRYTYLRKEYLYFDLNAGPGKYPYNGILHTGSPLIALQTADDIGINYNAVLIDNDKKSYNLLNEYLQRCGYANDNVYACLGDQVNVMQEIANLGRQQYYGLVYMDPPGNEPCWNLSIALSRQKCYKKIDFLYYLSANNLKRIQTVRDVKKLHERIAEISKKYWLIRKPVGAFQWTFLFGCNWGENGKGSYPSLIKHGFVRLESDEGQDVLKRLSLTREEYKRTQ